MRYPTPALWRVKPLGNHDGDSVDVLVDRGGVNETQEKWHIRLKNVWAPESADPGGLETRDFVRTWLASHDDGSEWPFLLETFRTPRSDQVDVTFGRYVGIIEDSLGNPLNLAVSEFVASRGYGGGIRSVDA